MLVKIFNLTFRNREKKNDQGKYFMLIIVLLPQWFKIPREIQLGCFV